MTIQDRVELVRSAVAQATDGLGPAEYREVMEELIADSEGWRMELEEAE